MVTARPAPRSPRAFLACAAALAFAGCFEDPPAPSKPVPEFEVFGTGDTMAYIGDTARFAVRTLPHDAEVTGYEWILSRADGRPLPVAYDTLETTEPRLSRVFRAEEAGRHSIQVNLLGVTQDWWRMFQPGYGFTLRVDRGRPSLLPDTVRELPFGPGNRIRVKASDPNGRVVKYHWSNSYGTFTDSGDAPEWALPDSLIGYQDIYCRVRDEDGQVSDTLRNSIRFTPRGLFGASRDNFTGLNALPGGGYLAAGVTFSFDTRNGDAWLARIDAEGKLLSQASVKRSYAFGAKGTGWFNALAAGGAGSHLAVGAYRDSTHNDGLFAVSDAQGKVLAQGFEEGPGNQEYHAAAWLKSGAWIAVGSAVPPGFTQDTSFGLFSLIRPDGTATSRRIARTRYLAFHCIAPAADGNALVGATGAVTFSAQGGFLYKLTPAGDTVWSRPVDPAGYPILIPRALIACKSGGFALLGSAYNGTVVERLDEDGNTVWTHVLYKNQADWIRSGGLAETPEGDLVAALDLPYGANPYSGLLFTRLDAQGAVKWSRRLGRAEDGVSAVAALPDGAIAAAGTLSPSAWLLKLGADGQVAW